MRQSSRLYALLVSNKCPDSNIAPGNLDDVARENRYRRAGIILAHRAVAGMLDQNMGQVGAICCAAGDGYRAQHVQSAGVGISTRLFDLADDVKWPELGNADGDLRVLEVAAAQFRRQFLLELLLRQPRGFDRAGERQRHKTTRIDRVFAAQRRLAKHGDMDLLPGL